MTDTVTIRLPDDLPTPGRVYVTSYGVNDMYVGSAFAPTPEAAAELQRRMILLPLDRLRPVLDGWRGEMRALRRGRRPPYQAARWQQTRKDPNR